MFIDELLNVKKWYQTLKKAEKRQFHESMAHAKILDEQKEIMKEIEVQRHAKGYTCPSCGSTHGIKYGKSRGLQRYKCKDCNKNYSLHTGTFMNCTHYPEKWILFVDCMLQGLSLRKSALIVGVHYVTLFYWRHKILHALAKAEPTSFEGIVEADETFFHESSKGTVVTHREPRKNGRDCEKRGLSKFQVCVLTARDRKKQTIAKVVGRGRITRKGVNDVLETKLTGTNILCTDGATTYDDLANRKGMIHHKFPTDKKIRVKRINNEQYHLQNVNGLHDRIKRFLAPFRGIASKYLDHYMAFALFRDAHYNDLPTDHVVGLIIQTMLLSEYFPHKEVRLRGIAI